MTAERLDHFRLMASLYMGLTGKDTGECVAEIDRLRGELAARDAVIQAADRLAREVSGALPLLKASEPYTNALGWTNIRCIEEALAQIASLREGK